MDREKAGKSFARFSQVVYNAGKPKDNVVFILSNENMFF